MKMRKKFFTLFELLISVGLLVILSVVLLRTLVLTADYWKFSAEQSTVYIDAKIIMSSLNEDISNMLYRKSPESAANKISVPLYTGAFNYTSTTTGYTYIKALTNTGAAGSSSAWCFALVTRTAASEDSPTGICKTAYVYYPPTLDGSLRNSTVGDDSNEAVPGRDNGVLLRGVVNESESGDDYLKGGVNLNTFYAKAMNAANLGQIADGVIDFKIEAYKRDGTTYDKITYSNTSDVQKGLSGVDALRLSMTLMPTDKLDEYRKVYKNGSNEERLDFVHKHGRKFTRTFWVN